MQWISNTFLYEFFYNILIWITDLFPGASIALAVILLTIIVKLLLAPLTYKSIMNQIIQKKLQPLLAQIRKDYPDKEEQSKKILELYKEHKTNPFSGCLLIIIQLPIIFALYAVFLQGLEINPDILYSFVKIPEALNTYFLGIDLAQKSIILAILAGASQFTQMRFSPAMQETKQPATTDEPSTQEQLAANMQKGMKYTMPIMITIFAYLVPAAVALYWIVSNLFTIAQELVIRSKIARKQSVTTT